MGRILIRVFRALRAAMAAGGDAPMREDGSPTVDRQDYFWIDGCRPGLWHPDKSRNRRPATPTPLPMSTAIVIPPFGAPPAPVDSSRRYLHSRLAGALLTSIVSRWFASKPGA